MPALPPPSDEELALAASRGQVQAFDELHRRLYRHTRAVCERVVNDPEEAQDLAMETWVRAYLAMAQGTFDPAQARSVRAWLFRIATNLCWDALRRRRPEAVSEEELARLGELRRASVHPTTPAARAGAPPPLVVLGEAWQTLSPLERLVLASKYWAEETWEHLAARLDRTCDQVRYIADKAKDKLEQHLI